jgi:flagellar basal body-associated protein FliL
MAATNPKQEPKREDERYGRPTRGSAPTTPARRSRWIAIAIVLVVLVVIGVIAYLVLYGGGNGSGGGGGLYGFVLAFSGEQARRLGSRISARQ